MSEREGVLKFRCSWTRSAPPPAEAIRELNRWRSKLFRLKLVGESAGIGYGNLSVRDGRKSFLITGTQTGGLKRLTARHYTKVTRTDPSANRVWCRGPVCASSESLTHGTIYSAAGAGAVIHVHSVPLWKKMAGRLPSTPRRARYGTAALAFEIKKKLAQPGLRREGVLLMKGHEGGFLAWGRTLERAGTLLLAQFQP